MRIFSLQEFGLKVQGVTTIYSGWRKGQVLFNVLYDERPEWADEIRATEIDPFYEDQKIPAFWEWLEQKIIEEST